MYPRDGKSWTRWLHEVRRAEFDGVIRHIPIGPDSTVLDIGCGDGFQLDLLRERFTRVFAIDPQHVPGRREGFAFSFAEALPFADRTFDLVFSSNVFEHLADRRLGMEEIARVLRPGGYVAHVVPSRFWKATSVLLNPVGYPLRVAEKWRAMRHAECENPAPGQRGLDEVRPPGILQVLSRWVDPPIHGTYTSHVMEYQSYARKRWLKTFTHPQLLPVLDEPLVCATQFGFLRFRFVTLRAWLARHGLGSTRGFVMRKTG
ncbi:MAG: class I SAM-dependent methyltransferase [Terriglobia bacterium]